MKINKCVNLLILTCAGKVLYWLIADCYNHPCVSLLDFLLKPGFLKLLLSGKLVCVCVGVRLPPGLLKPFT